MFARLLALLLVFAWVELAAFDLLEDLKDVSGEGAYTQSSKLNARGFSRRVSLTNNIVESAVSGRPGDALILHSTHSPSEADPVSSFRRVLDLHKLHRVFLI